MKKKLLAIILTLVMVLSIVPQQVFAASGSRIAAPNKGSVSDTKLPVKDLEVDDKEPVSFEKPVKESETTEPADDPAPAEEPADDPAPAEEPADDPAPAEEPADDPAPAEEPADDPAPAEEPADDPAPAEEPADDPAPAEEPADDPAPAEEPEIPKGGKLPVEAEPIGEKLPIEEITLIAMPAQDFTGSANDVNVEVSAPEGAFPAGTKMVVKAVDQKKVESAVRKVVDAEIVKILAVDITFVDAKGNEIEPKKAINVELNSAKIDEKKAEIVHIPDVGEPEKIELVPTADLNKVSFKSDQFSVYVVVQTGEDARLFVNFHRADGTVATMMINKRQIPQIDQYIFDPDAKEPEGSIFKGWTQTENYTSATPSKTIAEVRKEVEEKLNTNITDGTKMDYYAMVFYSYKVTYLDEHGVYVAADQVLQRIDSTTKPTHNVTRSYTPYPTGEEGVSATFIGWQQLQPEVTGEMVIYKSGDSFTVEENEYILKAYTEKGHWLSFDENLSGATYTEPQFVAIGGKPSTPTPPTRTGYTFDGWYTGTTGQRDGTVTGELFNFNEVLAENKTVYAKWNKATTAKYSVVIWKQNVDGARYDYGETVEVTGATVGNNTYAVTASGNGVSISTGSGSTNK